MSNVIAHETYPASATALSTGLNSLADGANAISAAIVNTDGDTLMDRPPLHCPAWQRAAPMPLVPPL